MAALAPLASWWSFLGPDLNVTAVATQLNVTFSPMNPNRWWFIGWAALPFALLASALFYASPLALRRRWALFAAAAVLVVTLYSLLNFPSVGLFLGVPLALSVWWVYGA